MDIEKLAREAGFNDGRCLIGDQISASWGGLERFAAAVRQEALEEAAKVADDLVDPVWHASDCGPGKVAPAIRALAKP